MTHPERFESVVPVSRRNVLKAGAVTAVGAGLFSGTASATNPEQVNFCGCSQVCLTRYRDRGGAFVVITAFEGEDGWEFPDRTEETTFRGGEGDFCYDVEGTDLKIIGVRTADLGDDPKYFLYGNPGRCARDALAAWLSENTEYELVNTDDTVPEFGEFRDPAGQYVEVVRGRCGQPGRSPPGQDR